ncbi:hypothetical protein [Bradyrhizobium guangdongense]
MYTDGSTSTPDSAADDCGIGVLESGLALTDEEFIKKFRKLSGPSPLKTALSLAALCAAKTSFSAMGLTLKRVGLSSSKFSKYSQIGRDPRIEKIKGQLPAKAGYSVLYALSRLTDDEWQRGFGEEIITPQSSRSEIEAFRTGVPRKSYARVERVPFFASVTVTESKSAKEIEKLRAALISLCEEFGCEAAFRTSEVPPAATRMSSPHSDIGTG